MLRTGLRFSLNVCTMSSYSSLGKISPNVKELKMDSKMLKPVSGVHQALLVTGALESKGATGLVSLGLHVSQSCQRPRSNGHYNWVMGFRICFTLL